MKKMSLPFLRHVQNHECPDREQILWKHLWWNPSFASPFPSKEEDEDEPPSLLQFGRSTVQTETVSQITTKSYIQTPAKDAPATTSKAMAAKKIPAKKVPSKSRPRPGAGALNYTPSKKDIRKTQKAGDILPAREKTSSRYRSGSLALQEVRYYQEGSNLLIRKLPFQ